LPDRDRGAVDLDDDGTADAPGYLGGGIDGDAGLDGLASVRA
jgi:hypothetical protein